MGTGCAAVSESRVSGKRIVIVDGFKVELDLSTQVLSIHTDAEEDSHKTPLGDVSARSIRRVSCRRLSWLRKPKCSTMAVRSRRGCLRRRCWQACRKGKPPRIAWRRARRSRSICRGDGSGTDSGCCEFGTGSDPWCSTRRRGSSSTYCRGFSPKRIGVQTDRFLHLVAAAREHLQQDRMLQSKLDRAGIKALANALRANPSVRATYETHLRLISRLPNPSASRTCGRSSTKRNRLTPMQWTKKHGSSRLRWPVRPSWSRGSLRKGVYQMISS